MCVFYVFCREKCRPRSLRQEVDQREVEVGGADECARLRAERLAALAPAVLVEVCHGGTDADAGLYAEVHADLPQLAAVESGTEQVALLSAVFEAEERQAASVELSAITLCADIPAGVCEGGPPAHAGGCCPVLVFMVLGKCHGGIATIEREAVMAAEDDVGAELRCQRDVV